ncbi:hypothetical protein Thimo_2728 [Thioflavicoccus mobilis 8321]|uniref:Uncharacterized protein n=1 Tax=Thioflavicoccus mobilis 8321 TaxID=765912 RepID=L0GXD9_9GAMM|nr:hypothetical protein Thimo_2728 [Thioflavicoccus mobilis 8321]
MSDKLSLPEKRWWKCSECQHVVHEKSSPTECPACHKRCTFADVTCYIPDCGGPSNPDPKLI